MLEEGSKSYAVVVSIMVKVEALIVAVVEAAMRRWWWWWRRRR
jgi:uncharacterized membrane protein